MARSHVPQFANLPEYAGPGVLTRARNVVKVLTELPERFTEYVDENVAASKEDMRYLVRKYPHGYEGSESRKPERDRS